MAKDDGEVTVHTIHTIYAEIKGKHNTDYTVQAMHNESSHICRYNNRKYNIFHLWHFYWVAEGERHPPIPLSS